MVGAWKSPKPWRGGVIARDGRCIHGRGRDKRAHRDTSTEPRCESGGLRHNGKHDIYSHAETSGARRFSDFHAPPCADFRTFLSAINFGAPLARLARLPSFTNLKLACPLCPLRLHGARTSTPHHAPAPPRPAAPEFDRLKSL